MINAFMDSIMSNPEVAAVGLFVGYAAGTMMQKRKMRRRGMGGMGFP